jgi:hypothetical protein
MKKKYLLVFFLLISSKNSYAVDSVSFPKLWEMVVKNSPSIKSVFLEKKSSEKSKERLSKFDFPSFYANSNLTVTNNPGVTFTNFLNEGQVKQDDFIPSNLNSPSNHIFNQSDVGIDYLIYDSGSRSSIMNIQEHQSISIDYQKKLVLLNQYVKILNYFSNYILERDHENDIKLIENNLISIINKYQVGEKSNPVGYNGLLSLKGIQNNIDLTQLEIISSLKEIKNSLKILTGNPDLNFEPDLVSFEKLLEIYASSSKEETSSFQVNIEKENSIAIKESISQEKSKYLPKIGVFAQENLALGERGGQSNYILGAYLKFNFKPSEFGGEDEKELLALAKEKNAESINLNDTLLQSSAKEEIKKNNQKLILIRKSYEIISEQIKVIFNLYRNGNANISQISELINRQIDLINQKYFLKNLILKNSLELLSLTQKDVQPENIWKLKI